MRQRGDSTRGHRLAELQSLNVMLLGQRGQHLSPITVTEELTDNKREEAYTDEENTPDADERGLSRFRQRGHARCG